MKQKIRFDLGLYIEGLRQLRVTGIIGLISMVGIMLIMLISLGEYTLDEPRQFTGLNYMPWLILAFVGFMPLMMLQMFHFMNKRNASDLYHSLPHTRSTIYLSLTAAVVTWVLALIFATVLTGMIGAWVMPERIALSYSTLLPWILYCISASILVGGAIMIAKGLTGTLLNSIVLTGLILFLPRFLLSLFIGTIESNPIFASCISNSFTANTINPVVGMVFAVFGMDYRMNVGELAIHIPAIIYGFVLGLIYFAVGGFLFCRRNSETASQSAPNRLMQAVYRILVAMTMCSVVIALLFVEIYLYSYDDMQIYPYVIGYLAIIFVYFLYELLTTHRLKNLVKAIPTLGIIAVLNVIMYFGLVGIYNSAMNFRPAPDEINSVTVRPDIVSDYGYMNYSDYVLTKIDGVKLDDPQVLKDVSYSLEQSLKMTEEDVSEIHCYDSRNQMLTPVFMEIETDGKNVTRNIYMTEERYAQLNQAILESENFRKAWLSPPESSYVSIYDYYGSFSESEQAAELYDKFCAEVKNADFETWFNAHNGYESAAFTFTVNYLSNGTNYNIDIPVYQEAAPETIAYYYQETEEMQKKKLKALTEQLREMKEAGVIVDGNVYVNVRDDAYTSYFQNEWYLNNTDTLDIPLEVLETRADGALKTADKIMEISVAVWYVDGISQRDFGGMNYNFMYPADETTIAMLKELQEEYAEESTEVIY